MDNPYLAHIQEMDADSTALMLPDFPLELEWIHTKPLSFEKELKGKLVVLDFFTYCCINCMHVLPELKILEEKYQESPIVFIGVHSPKFENEKRNENVACAASRYEINHPIVSDPEMFLWKALGIRGWPTIAVIGPKGNLIYIASGEGRGGEIDKMLKAALDFYKPLLNLSPLQISLPTHLDHPLLFPGKVAIHPSQNHLIISDSNHNRIVITTPSGQVIETIGSGKKGLVDGSFKECQFFRPQGVCVYQEKVIVADTENHALRAIDFASKTVTTLAGNGIQGRDLKGGKQGIKQLLSTPWDVAYAQDHLLIAMAGTHQIWAYEFDTQKTYVYSGKGAEMNLNSNHLLKACFAQPSGLAVGEGYLFIADSESSSIRAIDLYDHKTETLVGGDPLFPKNLFAFGDKLGIGTSAKLQHPLGVAFSTKTRKVLVADTYNHKIKLLNPATCEISHLAGSGKPGYQDGPASQAEFYEPSGLCLSLDERLLYVADTNNHLIRLIDMETKEVSTLAVEGLL